MTGTNNETQETMEIDETQSVAPEAAAAGTERDSSGPTGVAAAWRHAKVAPKAIVEAALLAAGQPLTLKQLVSLFPGEDAPGDEEVAAMLAELLDETAGRGVELVEVAGGWRYQLRRDVHLALGPLWQEKPPRYSRALLETLALVAYRQPITRGEIENVRGVSVSTQIIRTLEERDWIRVVGHRDLPGKPALYGTTRTFLDDFNLKTLSELPPLAEILELDEIEPELDLGEPGTVQPPKSTADSDDDDPETESTTAGQNGPQAVESEPQTTAENTGAGEDECAAGETGSADEADEDGFAHAAETLEDTPQAAAKAEPDTGTPPRP